MARRGQDLATSLGLGGLDRINDLLVDTDGAVDVDLRFRQDTGGRNWVSGTLHAGVRVVCQRCLEPMALELAPEIELVIVGSEEEAEALPDDLEPLVCVDGGLDLRELVQDELILALPVIARHEGDARCVPFTEAAPGGDGVSRGSPFAALAALKSNADNDE